MQETEKRLTLLLQYCHLRLRDFQLSSLRSYCLNTRRGWGILFRELLSRKSLATSLNSLCDWYPETQTSRQPWWKEAKTLILGKHGSHSVIVSPTCFALQPVWPALCLEQRLWRLISRPSTTRRMIIVLHSQASLWKAYCTRGSLRSCDKPSTRWHSKKGISTSLSCLLPLPLLVISCY